MHDLIRYITFSIAAAWLLGLVAQQFRQPILLAYLVGGFILGPAGCGLIGIRGKHFRDRGTRPRDRFEEDR